MWRLSALHPGWAGRVRAPGAAWPSVAAGGAASAVGPVTAVAAVAGVATLAAAPAAAATTATTAGTAALGAGRGAAAVQHHHGDEQADKLRGRKGGT